jgi:hypothetical protein
MIITCWILLIVFGLLSLIFLKKILFNSINKSELFLMLFSIIISALSAGVLFGGLVI